MAISGAMACETWFHGRWALSRPSGWQSQIAARIDRLTMLAVRPTIPART
jgi:hypothetical protein